MFINKILNSLNERLDKNKSLTVQQELGYKFDVSFTFNGPATIDEIQQLENTLHITLPKDYKEFILRHNGANLFIHKVEGASYELLSLSGIRECHGYLDYPPNWYPIAYGMDGEILVINSGGITNNEYLYWLEDGVDYEDFPLGINFEIWLDRLIMAQGNKFWEWPIYKGENFYKAFELDEKE